MFSHERMDGIHRLGWVAPRRENAVLRSGASIVPASDRRRHSRSAGDGKTFAEVRPLADVLGIDGPLVIESGGGIARRVGSSWRLESCGAGTKALREAVPIIEQRSGARLRLYSAMRLDEAAAASGVRTGTRFHHLSGPARKGSAAAQRVRDEIAASPGAQPFVVALGYAPIDVAFLSLADIPIIMPRRNGTPDPLLIAMLPEARIAPAAGPEGWARAIDEISDSLTSRVGSARRKLGSTS